jgi:hypothetical protein
VYRFGGVWCLDIRLDNRGEHGSLKNLGSERKVPLHPAVIEEGFLRYVAKLPKDGPLFPNLTPDLYGKRGGSGSKRLCRWIRVNLGMDHPRKGRITRGVTVSSPYAVVLASRKNTTKP